jgi:hypothetical protein
VPLFRNTEPDLRAIIAYIVARSLDRGITLTQTRLVKLLYLVDVDRVAGRAKPLSGLRWVFFHYGPYALELPETLAKMEGSEIITRRYGDAILYTFAPGAPSGDDWVSSAQRSVDRVVARFAPLEQNELLDHVYFHTGPMIGAKRGEPLDLSRAADYREPHRRAPLKPPAAPPDVRERLDNWRDATSRRLAPVELDPPGQFFDDPAEDMQGEGVSGRLSVPDGTTL